MTKEIEVLTLKDSVKTTLSNCINTLENTLEDQAHTRAVTARIESQEYVVLMRVEKRDLTEISRHTGRCGIAPNRIRTGQPITFVMLRWSRLCHAEVAVDGQIVFDYPSLHSCGW